MVNGIYVHFPFCLKKCGYCDFVSSPVSGDSLRFKDYLSMLKKELDMRKSEIGNLRGDITIFLGGGTPSCVPLNLMEDFLKCFNQFFCENNIKEFTCESNPKTADLTYLKSIRKLGVNRLSIGFQSLDDQELRSLGRVHSSSDCINAFADAKEAGFENINVDMMLGIPHQTLNSLEDSLDGVIKLRPEHISVYSLILEDNTPLCEAVRKGEIEVPSDDLTAVMYEMTVQKLKDAGYMRYEISNFALPEKECKHNMVYWDNDLYCGLGVAAHSHSIRGVRKANVSSIDEYINMLKMGKFPIAEQEELDISLQIADAFMLKLRCAEGLNLKETSHKYGANVEEIYQNEIENLIKKGLIERHKDIIRLSDKGFLLGNIVFSEFML